MPKITASTVENLKPNPVKRIELPDTILPGLYLICQPAPTGSKSWAVRYRFGGRSRKLTLGRADVLKVAEAREMARQALKSVAEGRDPGVEKKERSSADQTISAHVETFLERRVRAHNRPRTAAETERLFRVHVLPLWRSKGVHDIKRRDVVALLDGVVDKGTPIAANRTFAAVRAFFNWLNERGVVEVSPCLGVKAPTPETSRDRVLTDNELRLLLRAIADTPYPFGPAAALLLLTASRRDEVIGMRRGEVEGDLWTIPADRSKNGEAHEVPLAPAARAILDAVPRIMTDRGKVSDLVFTTTGVTPASGFSNSKEALDRRMLALARADAEAAGRDPDEVAPPPWRLHDLRCTAATAMARLGVQPHVVEACLNHRSGTVSGVARVYNRHSYRDEKRDALARWAQHLSEIKHGR